MKTTFPWLLLLLVITGAVYSTVPGHDLLTWDDDVFIYQNPLLQARDFSQVAQAWRQPYAHLYVPITYTVWIGVAHLAQVSLPGGQVALSPRVFHTASVVLHLLAALAAFLLLRALVGDARAAALGALLFALHPLQVETVSWASELKDLLGGLWSLLALWLYVLAGQAENSSPGKRRGYYLGATLIFALALLSKPNTAVLPLLAVLLDWHLQRFPLRQSLLRVLPWLALAGLLAFFTRQVQPAAPELVIPWLQRPLVMGDALACYLGKLVWPANLAADYGHSPSWVLAQPATAYLWLIPVSVVGLALALRRRLRGLTTGLLFFCLAPLPALGLVPFDFQQYSTVADHYAYLAVFGPALALAWLVRGRRQLWVTAACTILLFALASQSLLQTFTWTNSLGFWQHTLQVNPHSLVAHNNLGTVYLLAGKMPEAEAQFRAALVDHPRDADALVNLALALIQQGRGAEGLAFLERALQVRSGDLKAHLLAGQILMGEKRWEEALGHFLAVLDAEPANLTARYSEALCLLRLQRTAEAKAQLLEVLRQRSDFTPARQALEGLK